jgi:hypothetical protein
MLSELAVLLLWSRDPLAGEVEAAGVQRRV